MKKMRPSTKVTKSSLKQQTFLNEDKARYDVSFSFLKRMLVLSSDFLFNTGERETFLIISFSALMFILPDGNIFWVLLTAILFERSCKDNCICNRYRSLEHSGSSKFRNKMTMKFRDFTFKFESERQ